MPVNKIKISTIFLNFFLKDGLKFSCHPPTVPAISARSAKKINRYKCSKANVIDDCYFV